MYTIAGFFLTMLSGTVTTVTAAFCLTPKCPRARCIAGYLAVLFFPVLFKTLCSDAWLTFASLLTQFTFLLFHLICFKENVFTKLLVYLLIICVATMIPEYLSLFLMEKMFGYSTDALLNRSTVAYLLTSLTCLILLLLAHWLLYIVWNAFARKQTNSYMLFYAVLPLISITFLTFLGKRLLFPDPESNVFFLPCLLIIFLVGIVLFIYIARQQEKNEAAAAYEEMTRLHALEAAEYQALEARSEELSRIRHDINHQLSTIDALLRAGNRPAARQFAREVLERLNDGENETLSPPRQKK